MCIHIYFLNFPCSSIILIFSFQQFYPEWRIFLFCSYISPLLQRILLFIYISYLLTLLSRFSLFYYILFSFLLFSFLSISSVSEALFPSTSISFFPPKAFSHISFSAIACFSVLPHFSISCSHFSMILHLNSLYFPLFPFSVNLLQLF